MCITIGGAFHKTKRSDSCCFACAAQSERVGYIRRKEDAGTDALFDNEIMELCITDDEYYGEVRSTSNKRKHFIETCVS